jgi:hypothetical protein
VSVSSRDFSQQPTERGGIGFTRGVQTPPPMTEHSGGGDGADDGMWGYAEVTPASPPGFSEAAAAASSVQPTSPSMDRPLTFAGGSLPEDFLRLTVPVEVPIESGGRHHGELGSVPAGGLLLIYVAEVSGYPLAHPLTFALRLFGSPRPCAFAGLWYRERSLTTKRNCACAVAGQAGEELRHWTNGPLCANHIVRAPHRCPVPLQRTPQRHLTAQKNFAL